MIRFACALSLVVIAAGAARADTVPKRVPGLWETVTSTNTGSTKGRECIDEATDRLVYQASTALTCRKLNFQRSSDGYLASGSCNSGGMAIEESIAVSGDFANFAKAETNVSMSGLPGETAPRTFRTTIENRRLGDCEPGQQPGDVILPNGDVFHVAPPAR
jgi:hypothetical protein